MKSNKSGIAIIEIIIGMLVFSIGLVSIYMAISSSINLNDYNKNQIIASNLARESLEIVKNLRDSNYVTLHKWTTFDPNLSSGFEIDANYIQTGVYYKIENNFNILPSIFSANFDKINAFGEGAGEINGKMKDYELCIDSNNKYTYDCANGNKKSGFFRYVKFEDMKYNDGSGDVYVKDAYKVISKVIWYKRGYHETSITNILADYKRL